MIAQILTNDYVVHYRKFTGVGLYYELSKEKKREMIQQIVDTSKFLQSQAAFSEDEINNTLEDISFEDETKIKSVSTNAADELYTIIKTICLIVETFFKPLLPQQIEFQNLFEQLHEDTLKLCQCLVFNNEMLN